MIPVEITSDINATAVANTTTKKLSGLQKLWCLISSLLGNAETEVNNLSVTESNCRVAVDLIKQRVVKPDEIVIYYITHALNPQSVAYHNVRQ